MSARSISRTAVTTSLTLARFPLDLATVALPGPTAADARLKIDRADASLRAAAASLLDDEWLRSDADRRRDAAEERLAALRLRREARTQMSDASSRTRARRDEAAHQRAAADETAAQRRRTAENRREKSNEQAAETAEQRKREVERQANQREQQIERAAKVDRLDATSAKAAALDEQADALRTREEADRLGRAAAAVKEDRKES